MAIQDQNGVTNLPQRSGVYLSPGVHSVLRVQLADQFSCEDNNSTKARKPYTITKQREKWTDEEHKKFLEALKLYGRAWPRIEEHVGSKTAVQIRSHAQKFFSKVIRDTSGNSSSLAQSIEIPPPRPKRKPMHPYPRKLVEIRKKGVSITEQPLRSCSLRTSDFDQENVSPKSVLSAAVSETAGSSDSDTPARSLSAVSSVSVVHTTDYPLTEPKTSFDEDGSALPTGLNTGSVHDEQPLVKPELLNNGSASTKDDASEESSCRTLKLFGTTLLVTDTGRSSSTTMEVCKPIPAKHINQLQDENSDIAVSNAATVSWWNISLNLPFTPLHNERDGKHLDSTLVEFEDKEVQKEGSQTCSSSNNSSVHVRDNNGKSDEQAKSHVHWFNMGVGEFDILGYTTRSSETSAISKLRVRPKTSGKGFVPYKRCMADRENKNSFVTGEEREVQRIRLSL